jgi:uncharacterized lipoprotein YmbA
MMDVDNCGATAADRRPVSGLVALVLAALCGAGCLELPKESTPITYWVLGPVAGDASASVQPDGPTRTLVVGPVSLPGYLDRAEVMQREGAHQLRVERFDHWGDSLAEQIPWVLAEDLMILSPGMIAEPYPPFGGGSADLQLVVTVLGFEVDADGDVQLLADWKLGRPGDQAALAHRVARLTESAGDRSVLQIVAAMSRALGALAREVAGELPESADG